MARVRGLDAVRATLSRLRAAIDVSGIRVEVPPEAAEKLDYLAAGGRDLTVATPVLEREIAAELTAGLAAVRDGAPPATAAVRAGQAVLRRLRLRVAQGGADLAVRPLAASTIARKGSDRPFVATGGLLRALSAATVRVLRRGR